MRLSFQVFEAFRSSGIAEVAGSTVPGCGLSGVAGVAADTDATKKVGIECRAQPQRRRTVARVGGALVEQSRRRKVPGAEERVAASYQGGDLRR